MKKTAVTMALAALLFAGCASFKTEQTDISPKDGSREIKTVATARTFFAGKSALANWKASQTDKTQGASVGSLSQESNTTDALKALADVLKAAKSTATPLP